MRADSPPEFFYFCDRNLEDVDNFYNKKYADAARRLKLLQDRYGKYNSLPTGMSKDDVEDLMGALLELRGQLKHLQWYGEVNRRGFVKITKKLDKRVGQSAMQKRYLETKVDTKQFATNMELSDTKSKVNEWIAKLADVKVQDDANSIHSSRSLGQINSASLPVGLAEITETAVREDNAGSLRQSISLIVDAELRTAFCLNLLHRAIALAARECIDELLAELPSLEETDDINGRNCIHRLIIGAGRSNPFNDEDDTSGLTAEPTLDQVNYIKPAAPPVLSSRRPARKETSNQTNEEEDNKTVATLKYILEKLRPHQRSALRARDVYGRVPLHYSAQYGFFAVSKILVTYMQKWGKFKGSDGIDAPYWPDVDGYAPLHLSVIGGHPLTTKALLEADGLDPLARRLALRKSLTRSGEVLALAVKSNFLAIVKMIVEAGFDVDYQDDQGETALHVAARFGNAKCAEILLQGDGNTKASTEVMENSFGWTPLHVASVDGHLDVVQILVAAGARLVAMDSSGWTAREHAALRGHINIARVLANLTPVKTSENTESFSEKPLNEYEQVNSLTDRRSALGSTTNGTVKRPEPVKSFGHRYLTKESMVLVSLGSMDNRKALEAVNLDQIPIANAHSTQLDTALSVIVSAQGAAGEPSIIDLPVQDTVSTEPIVFHTSDPTCVKLLFDIVPTYAGSSNQIVGRAVALLSSIRPSLGSKRISLQGDLSIPIVAVNTLEVIGTVNFNFLVITPFAHPKMNITESQTYWKSMASTMLIGHRGLGKNTAGRDSLQLGENTIQSFIAAANLGASYVEFDVQLTKDLVPVIYHDFLVSETGIDAPVHTLTLEQFLHVNDEKAWPKQMPPSDEASAMSINGMKEYRKARSLSLSDAIQEDGNDLMSERMKVTRDFKAKGFKANTRGNFIQGAFTTLEDMFRELPESTGFNIEMKYPMLFESEEQEMDTYAVELNSFVDTVLTKVYDWGGTSKRNIIFSSFNPDICLLLSFKQPSIPVLFLTDAGMDVVGDIRASSLQEAIRFASRWNLLGIVSSAGPLVTSPRLVKVVKESGLVCVSYGTLNNDPGNVQVSRHSARLLLAVSPHNLAKC